MAQSPDAEAAKVAALRELLPATGAGIYLDTATRGPLPAETAEAMRQADDWELRVGRVVAGREEDVAQRAAEAQAVLAALLGATDSEAIVLTHGRDDAIELARRVLGQKTEVVSHVDSVSGGLAEPGSGPLLDASLSAGAIRLSVADLGAQAVAVATDRWLLGPEGIAALWLRDRAAARAIPPRELPRTTLLGVARSVGWLAMYVGLEWAFERTTRLTRRLAEDLAGREGVELLTPSPPPAAIVTFRLAAWAADEAADELNHRVQALVRPLPDQNAIRASVGWFNTDEELARFADAVAELARHTSHTLPRRPRLVVLPEA